MQLHIRMFDIIIYFVMCFANFSALFPHVEEITNNTNTMPTTSKGFFFIFIFAISDNFCVCSKSYRMLILIEFSRQQYPTSFY